MSQAWDYAIGCHWGHKTDFLAALLCYALFFPAGWEEKCKVWSLEWVLPVIGYNLMCELVLCNTWHWLTYAGPYAKGAVSKSVLTGGQKLNKDNQYEKDSADVGMFTSSSGNLQREIFFTTLGWIQSSLFQCTFMHLWASGKLPYYNDFWAAPCERRHDGDPRPPTPNPNPQPQTPARSFTHGRCRSDWSVGHLLFVTYWREFHFYWCHRMIHPWYKKGSPLKPLDIGQFLYTHFHSLHHKSYLLRQIFLLILSPFRLTDFFDGAGTTRDHGQACRCTRWSTSSTTPARCCRSSSRPTRSTTSTQSSTPTLRLSPATTV